MNHIVRFLGLQFVVICIVALVLGVGWAFASPAPAAIPGLDCHAQPLTNGRVGELVTVCMPAKVKAKKARKAPKLGDAGHKAHGPKVRHGVTTVVE